MAEIKDVRVKTQNILALRHEHIHVSELPKLIGPGFMALGAEIEKRGVQMLGAPYVMYSGMTGDIRLDENDMSVEIGFPIGSALEAPGFVSYERPAYDAVQVTYTGDYTDGMVEVYKEMAACLKQKNRRFLGRAYEVYMTGPEVPVDEQVTVITMPYEEG